MALVPASSSTAPAAGGLNPGSNISSGGAAAGASGWSTPAVVAHSSVGVGAWLMGPAVTALASGAWPTASLALLFPFSITTQLTAQSACWCNGTVVSGNVDAGIYNEDGTRVISVGGVAQAGISATQQANFSAPTAIAAGSYFFALVLDNITGTVNKFGPGAGVLSACGVQQAAAAYPLPASVTLAAPANNFLPAGWAAAFVSVL